MAKMMSSARCSSSSSSGAAAVSLPLAASSASSPGDRYTAATGRMLCPSSASMRLPSKRHGPGVCFVSIGFSINR
jgi:hypothetical protein